MLIPHGKWSRSSPPDAPSNVLSTTRQLPNRIRFPRFDLGRSPRASGRISEATRLGDDVVAVSADDDEEEVLLACRDGMRAVLRDNRPDEDACRDEMRAVFRNYRPDGDAHEAERALAGLDGMLAGRVGMDGAGNGLRGRDEGGRIVARRDGVRVVGNGGRDVGNGGVASWDGTGAGGNAQRGLDAENRNDGRNVVAGAPRRERELLTNPEDLKLYQTSSAHIVALARIAGFGHVVLGLRDGKILVMRNSNVDNARKLFVFHDMSAQIVDVLVCDGDRHSAVVVTANGSIGKILVTSTTTAKSSIKMDFVVNNTLPGPVVGALLLLPDLLLHWTVGGFLFLTKIAPACLEPSERVPVANHVAGCVKLLDSRIIVVASDDSHITYKLVHGEPIRSPQSLESLLFRLRDVERLERETNVESERVNKRIKSTIAAMNFRVERDNSIRHEERVARFFLEPTSKFGFTVGEVRRVVLLDLCLMPVVDKMETAAGTFNATITVNFKWGSWLETQSRICAANGKQTLFEFDLSNSPVHLRYLPLNVSANAWFSLQNSGFGTHLCATRFDVLDWGDAEGDEDDTLFSLLANEKAKDLVWIKQTCAFRMDKLKLPVTNMTPMEAMEKLIPKSVWTFEGNPSRASASCNRLKIRAELQADGEHVILSGTCPDAYRACLLREALAYHAKKHFDGGFLVGEGDEAYVPLASRRAAQQASLTTDALSLASCTNFKLQATQCENAISQCLKAWALCRGLDT